ncbi:uncharacterized protein METZ01_LOCUS418703, partial [marine metagenome]
MSISALKISESEYIASSKTPFFLKSLKSAQISKVALSINSSITFHSLIFIRLPITCSAL